MTSIPDLHARRGRGAGVWASAAACMPTHLMLADQATALRADPRGDGGDGVCRCARPRAAHLVPGENAKDLLATDDAFDPGTAAERDDGFVALQHLAVEPIMG